MAGTLVWAAWSWIPKFVQRGENTPGSRRSIVVWSEQWTLTDEWDSTCSLVACLVLPASSLSQQVPGYGELSDIVVRLPGCADP